MTADRSAGSRSPGAVQETAQALVAGGELVGAVTMLDRYLAEFDGDWGMWLYFAGLCGRLGKREEAVAAYRASARQLEGDGHFARARDALVSAVRLVPWDEPLKRELDRVGRLSRRPPPELVRSPDPVQETMLLPVVEAKLPEPAAHLTSLIPGRARSAKLPEPAVHLTSVIPGRARTRSAPPAPEVKPNRKPEAKLAEPAVHLTGVIPGRGRARRSSPPEVTDPHCPIFDILDAERAPRAR